MAKSILKIKEYELRRLDTTGYEIIKWYRTDDDESRCITLALIKEDEEPGVRSIGNRLLEECDILDDYEICKKLANIGIKLAVTEWSYNT